jgi:D-mannonate dehydratase
LPAKKKFVFKKSEKYVKIEKKLKDLKAIPGKTSTKEREKLYGQIRKLETVELRKYRDN